MTGVLCLNGGDEFRPGNEPHDALLRGAAAGRPALIVATAAADHPEMAVRTAQQWFDSLGLRVVELRARTRGEAMSASSAAQASAAGLFYLVGGDPGRVVRVLQGSTVWSAIVAAWRGGAALAGSSAGAMAMCEWTLLRHSFPGHTRRRPDAALNLVPGTAVLPHYDAFGERWIPSAQETLSADALLLGLDERTAAVWQEGIWTAMGAGAVTLVRGDARRRFDAGGRIDGLPQPSAGGHPPLSHNGPPRGQHP
jgi:cyanophycinase